MNIVRRALLFQVTSLLFMPLIAHSAPIYDFEYNYTNPYYAYSPYSSYITSVENAVLYTEGSIKTWKPDIGGATFETTTPGVITYHFDFDSMGYSDPISEISLWMSMPIFHWAYSQGHNILYGSNDGSSWTTLAELADAAYGTGKDLGTVVVPETLLGANDLWLKVELYSYGPLAYKGGINTNTSQLSRSSGNNTSFSLGVNFAAEQGSGSTIPTPSTWLLMLIGGVCLAGISKDRRSSFCSPA